MTTQPTHPGGPASATHSPLNAELLHRPRNSGVELSGSLYAVPPEQRPAAARLLAEQRCWIHADVFADGRTGVSVDQINQLADDGIGPIDVHLLTSGALHALDTVCRPGIARVTFPFEGVSDTAAVAARIRSTGATPWLAISPGTTLTACADALPHVDGLLVMLIEPGTRQQSDPAQLTKVNQASATGPVGVDGGVGETNLDDVLEAGSTYIVIGRRLFSRPTSNLESPR